MAFTLRPNEEQEKDLEKLMELTGENTKAKAIFAIAQRADMLFKYEEELSDLRRAINQKIEADRTIENLRW